MANLQYIGARYVPKFYENSLDPSSMEWESGHGYEPLTVVTYNSDTYTSKIPVPATVGDPAGNPTYWAKTGAFNASIEALRNVVNGIINDIGDKTILTENEDINTVLLATNTLANGGLDVSIYKEFDYKRYDYLRLLAGVSDPTDESFNGFQGAVYDSKRDVYCLSVMASDESKSALAIVDANDPTNVILNRVYNDSSLGHAASLCYNSKSDIYAIRPDNNTVKTINPSTLNVINTYTIVYPDGSVNEDYIRAITFDDDRGCYYGVSFTRVYVFDESFVIQEMYNFTNRLTDEIAWAASDGLNLSSLAIQDVAYHNDKLFIIWQNANGITRQTYITRCNLEANFIGTNQLVVSNRSEPEGLTFKGDKLLSFSVFMMFEIHEVIYNPRVSGADVINIFNGGISIGSNKDIDYECYDNGVYTYTAAQSLTHAHAPFEADTSILSIPIGGNQWQFAIGSSATSGIVVAMRKYLQSGRRWSDWIYNNFKKFERGTTYTFGGAYSGYITASGKCRFFVPDYTFDSATIENLATITASGTVHLVDGTTYNMSDEVMGFYNRRSGVELQTATIDASYANQPCTVYASNIVITIATN